MIKVAPSILSADFCNLAEDIKQVRDSGADYLHIDVMDGIFVPNISMGTPVIKSIRKNTDMFLDVHLMIDRPGRYVELFSDSGADLINIHYESDKPDSIFNTLNQIKALNKKCGITIKPDTSFECIKPYLGYVDLLLIMTVYPGFGGQSFLSSQADKIKEARQYIDFNKFNCELEVDGGINKETAAIAVRAGADVLVSGNYIFKSADRKAAIDSLKYSEV